MIRKEGSLTYRRHSSRVPTLVGKVDILGNVLQFGEPVFGLQAHDQ
jgi:hypothetical protein